MKLSVILKNYFDLFSKKDIDKLSLLFSEDIYLQDWTSKVKSKKKVILFNKRMFKKFKSIKVNLQEIFYNSKNNSYSCKLKIVINKKKSINVVDLIYFNKKKQIKKIIAYLG
tara:strand:+ start:473 stop:808 length:336 start_codon:yes stop_codon:yes gene_type:complete